MPKSAKPNPKNNYQYHHVSLLVSSYRRWTGKHLVPVDLPEKETWDIKVTFIVIDKYNLVYPYQVSDKTMRTWNEDFIDILMTANWHYDNKRYDLPYKLAKGNFKL